MLIPFCFQKGFKATGCEDAPPIAAEHWAIVCDGLGGSGATKHNIIENGEPSVRTSGYIGSRLVADAVDRCFKRFQLSGTLDLLFEEQNRTENIQFAIRSMKEEIKAEFEQKVRDWKITKVRGRTLRTFPTTLAAAICKPYKEGGVDVLSMWAGDSRVYFLSPSKGLRLLTVDDAFGAEYAMNSSSEMNNCISYGFYFNINYAFYHIDEPGVLFCCSDGCFDYMRSPLHLEWLLMHTLSENLSDNTEPEGKETAESQEEHGDEVSEDSEPEKAQEAPGFAQIVSNAIMNNIYQNIGDDTTMAGWLFHIDNAEQMKELFSERIAVIDEQAVQMNNVINSLRDADNILSDLIRAHGEEEKISEARDLTTEFKQQIGEIWEEYRVDYAAFNDPVERGEF